MPKGFDTFTLVHECRVSLTSLEDVRRLRPSASLTARQTAAESQSVHGSSTVM